MAVYVPLRIVTMVIGLVFGYNFGKYIEIGYSKFKLPKEVIETLLYHGLKQDKYDGRSSSDEDDLDALCRDCCQSNTSDDDTDYSE